MHETDGLTSLIQGITIKKSDFSVIEGIYPDKNTSIEMLAIEMLESKHIIKDKGKATFVKKYAVLNGHANVKWGNQRNATVETENEIINKMVADNFVRPMRVTITKGYSGSIFRRCSLISKKPVDSRIIWCDNTHTAISHIRRGKDLLHKVPYYVIDVRQYPYTVYSKNLQWIDMNEIEKAVLSSLRLQKFMEKGGYNGYRWTIRDLADQLI